MNAQPQPESAPRSALRNSAWAFETRSVVVNLGIGRSTTDLDGAHVWKTHALLFELKRATPGPEWEALELSYPQYGIMRFLSRYVLTLAVVYWPTTESEGEKDVIDCDTSLWIADFDELPSSDLEHGARFSHVIDRSRFVETNGAGLKALLTSFDDAADDCLWNHRSEHQRDECGRATPCPRPRDWDWREALSTGA